MKKEEQLEKEAGGDMGSYMGRSFFHSLSIIPVYNCLGTCRGLKLMLYNHSIGLFLKPFVQEQLHLLT